MNFKRLITQSLSAALLAIALLIAPPAKAGVFVSVGIAPPAIPVYTQPICPGDGYIWTPGYWAWNGEGYVWVDGAWVVAPYVGALWTPGYWGWGGGGYFWHAGYWGRTVGFYGGINYGFGYFGTGFYGGYWRGGHFLYNRAYGHFGPGFRGGFYNHPVAGFSGRPGGASFTRSNASFAPNRGSAIAGHQNFAEAGANRSPGFAAANRGGFTQRRQAGTPATTRGGFEGNAARASAAVNNGGHPPAVAHAAAPAGGNHGEGASHGGRR